MRYLYPCVLTPEEEGGFFVALSRRAWGTYQWHKPSGSLDAGRRRSWCRSGWLRSRTLGYSDPEPRRQGVKCSLPFLLLSPPKLALYTGNA